MTTTTQLVRALARAAQPVTDEHKRELFQRVQKLKNVAEQPHVDKGMRDDVLQLEQHLARVLCMEEDLLKQQKNAAGMKKQMQHLRLQSDQELSKKLDRIQFLLGELAARMNTMARSRVNHEKRKRELDKKIQRTANNSVFQKKLNELERKLEKKKKNISPERLAAIRERIESIRSRVEQKEFIIPPPRFVYPEKQQVQHKMFFQEQMMHIPKEPLLEFKPFDTPAEQPLSTLESELPPPPAARKRTLMKRLFGL